MISQRQMRWKVCQDVKAAVKLCNELIKDPNSKSGYAINIRKFREYPSKPCVSNVKCAENTTTTNKKNLKTTQNPQKNFLKGQKSLFDIFQTKNLRMKLEKEITLRMLLFSMTVVRRVMKMVALAVTQEVVKVIAKSESILVLSPCETKYHG